MSDTYLDDYFRRLWRHIKATAGCGAGLALGIGGPLALLTTMVINHLSPFVLVLAVLPIGAGIYVYAKAELGFKPEFSEAAGNASWGGLQDLKQGGLIGRAIDPRIHPYIGQFTVWSWLWWAYRTFDVHYPGACHWTMCGPTGVGKDTGLIAKNIRDLKGLSKVVLDIKGEAAVRCANWCRKHGQQVVVLNLFNLHVAKRPDLASQGFNCLEGFDVLHPKCYELCKSNSAAMIVRRNGESGHWDSRAMALLTFCQLAMKWAEFDGKLLDANGKPCRRSATLADVNKMLWAPYRYAGNDSSIVSLHGMTHQAMKWRDKPGEPSRETLRFAAAAFYDENPSNEEISGAIATAKGQLEPLISDAVRLDVTNHPMVWINDPNNPRQRIQVPFKFEYLRDEVFIVFVIVPFEEMNELAIWTRLILTRAIKGIVKAESKPKVHSLLVVNEAHTVGKLVILDEAMNSVRYAGLRIWTIWQDFHQIIRNYGDFGNFLTNAGVISSYRVNERTTAEEIRWRLGITTEITETINTDPNRDGNKRNKSRSGGGFNLMNLERLVGLRARETICFVPEYTAKPLRLKTPVRLEGLDPYLEDAA